MNYLYVINDEKQLVGVVSYRDLLLAEPDSRVEDIMSRNIVQVDVSTKQEEVAKVIGRYDYVSLPVVDAEGILLGIITVDDVLDIVVREANEDIEMLLASGKEIDFKTKPYHCRVPTPSLAYSYALHRTRFRQYHFPLRSNP